MGVYGLSLYGQDTYGLAGFSVRAGLGFSADFVTADPVGVNGEGLYGQTLVTWTPPLGNWDNLRIMRQFTGFPTSIYEGTLVHESLKDNKINRIVDTDLKQGISVYYSLFVQSVDNDLWYLSGSAWTLVVEDHDFHELLQDALPDAAMRADYEASTLLPEDRKYPLQRFLEGPAFELDRTKSLINTLQHLYDPNITPAVAVPPLMSQFGITPESSIGVSRMRTIARNASYLNSKRGTVPGVEALASAFTGWGATVTVGINLALRDDHANWSASSPHTVISPTTTSQTDAEFGVTAGDASAITLRSADNTGREMFSAIPVSGSTAYTYSLDAYPVTTGRDVTLRLRYFHIDGTFLSEADGTLVSCGADVWTTVSSTLTTPASAAFAETALVVSAGAASDEVDFRNVQLEEGSSFTSYEPPRQAVITFDAPFTNYITTPSFENAVSPAFTATNASTAFDGALSLQGADSWQVTPTTLGTDTVVESNDVMPAVQGDPALLLASAYPASAVDVTATVRWLDGASASVHDHTEVISLTGSTWNQISVSCDCTLDSVVVGTGPGEAQNVQILLTWQDVVINLDAVGLYDAYAIDYFDGDTFGSETLWDGGTAHNAVSYYYPLKDSKESRLAAVLPNFLPLNRSFSLRYQDSV